MSPTRFLDSASRFAVFGMGVSGVAAANALVRAGKHVTLSDTRDEDKLIGALDKLDPKVEVVFGRNHFEGAQIVVTSPGLKPTLPIFDKVRQAKLPIISEVELAFELAAAPFISITGTDGKTTTTTLTGDIFARAGLEHVVAGNIGTPLCEVVEGVSAKGFIVAEISAFQLWSTHHFRSAASAITNIANDHLDYFEGDFDAYAKTKLRLLDQATSSDWALLNAHDAHVMRAASSHPGPVMVFAYGQDPGHEHALWSDGQRFFGRLHGDELGPWCDDVLALPLQGRHQQLNMLCAAGLGLSQGIALDVIVEALAQFKPLPHRMEPCGQRQGIRFWDDSKATNAHAALAGLRGLQGQIIPIIGGVDKQLDLSELVAFCLAQAPALVLIGQLAARARAELLAAGYAAERIALASSMQEATQAAFKLAQQHGAAHVSLSPACSSFDMYESYAHRGRVYKECVRAITGALATS